MKICCKIAGKYLTHSSVWVWKCRETGYFGTVFNIDNITKFPFKQRENNKNAMSQITRKILFLKEN
jgi:hypothetical protein